MGWSQAVAAMEPQQAAASATGPFAVAMQLSDGRVFLAVDRFGQQTLCYSLRDGRVLFAARADDLDGQTLAPQALFDYLFLHAVPSPQTVFGGIHRLPPGHYALFENGKLTVAPYRPIRFQTPAKGDFGKLKAEFRALLRTAVNNELGSGTPACFLSGGTDSSTVAGYIREVAGQVHTYSIGFDAEGYDEMEYARIAARHFGADHHEYYVTPDDLVRSIADVAASYDQPFGNSSALPAYYCALQAKGNGVQKLLAGDGGDELFGGNSRYAMQRVYGLYGQVPEVLRAGLIEPVLAIPGAHRIPLWRKGRGYVRDAKTPLPDRMDHYNLMHRLGMQEVLSPGFLAAVRVQGPLEQQRQVWAMAEADNELDRMLAFDWRYTLGESDLPKVRGTCSLAGMEVGYPMLDDALTDFSMRLPTSYKLRGFKLRWFFKEALRDFLPEAIITKQKKGFGLPFGVWATRHAPLRALATDSVRSFAQRGVVRPEFVRRLLDEHLPAHPGYYGEMVWILMMLEQWLRHHAPDWRWERA
jgi:asparagine synthase (glutamine-hydrolysing)